MNGVFFDGLRDYNQLIEAYNRGANISTIRSSKGPKWLS